MSNFFDPKSFAAGGFLDGQVADIVEVKATKFDYNGKVDPPANVIEMKIVRADGKERTEVYGTGAAAPTEDGNGVSSGLNKGCKFASFLFALHKTKFPVAKLNTDGLSALQGQRFVWKNAPVSGKDVFVPETYVGIADGDASSAQQDEDDLRDLVGTLILSAVRESGGSLKKTALTQKLGAKITDAAVKPRALALALQDSYLAALPGVNLDKGVLTLIAE
jgi:hypothetical protein